MTGLSAVATHDDQKRGYGRSHLGFVVMNRSRSVNGVIGQSESSRRFEHESVSSVTDPLSTVLFDLGSSFPNLVIDSVLCSESKFVSEKKAQNEKLETKLTGVKPHS